MTEEALVQGLRVRARTRQPGGDRGLTIAEDPFCRGSVQPFGQRSEHHGDLPGRGFQTGQGGVPSSTERGAAGRTSKRLDALGLAVLAIPKKPRGSEPR